MGSPTFFAVSRTELSHPVRHGDICVLFLSRGIASAANIVPLTRNSKDGLPIRHCPLSIFH